VCCVEREAIRTTTEERKENIKISTRRRALRRRVRSVPRPTPTHSLQNQLEKTSQISWKVKEQERREEVGVRHQCGVFFSSSFYARDFRLGEFGWRSASCYPSFHYIPLPPPSSGSSYILRSPSVITYYLSHIIETGWDKAHTGTDALVSFFINLDSHPAHSPNDTPEGKQALIWY